MKIIRTYLVLFFLLVPLVLTAQAPDGYVDDIKLVPNVDGIHLDTVKLKRTFGPLWFGPMGGVNGNLDLGELQLLRKPWASYSDTNNKYVNYIPDMGAGYFFGITADWQPINSYWGGSFRMYFWDNWSSTAYSEQYNDDIKTGYDNTTAFTYLTISPAVRYNIFSNFNVFAGLDVAINLGYESYLVRKHTFSNDIYHDYKYKFEKINTRFGGHLGIAYELVILDVNQRMRVKVAPFISIHAGTSMISGDKVNWNTITGRIGFALKLGPDVVEYDTIPYVPQEDTIPIILATLDRRTNITFPEFKLIATTISSGLAGVSGGLEETGIQFESAIMLEMAAKPDIIKVIKENVEIVLAGTNKPREKLGEKIVIKEIVQEKLETFNFNKSDATDLTVEVKKRLDQFADYLKRNQSTTIAIIGHSDDAGNFQQNDQRAKERAENAKKYLMKKGIPEHRLLAYGKGSIEPIASNKSESGRRQNRRVEIKIVPAAPRRR